MDEQARSFPLPRWLLWTLAVPVTLCVVLGLLALLRGDQWKARALESINRELAGELNVSEMTLSWWHGFPDVSVDLTHVALVSPEADTLIYIERMGLELGLWSLFGDEPELNSISLEGGRATLAQDLTGEWNVSSLLAEDEVKEASKRSLTVGHIEWTHADLSWSLEDGTQGALHLDRALVELATDSEPLRWDVEGRDATVDHPDVPKVMPMTVASSGSWTPRAQGAWAAGGDVELGGIQADWNVEGSAEKGWAARILVPKFTQRKLESVWSDHPWKGLMSLDHQVSLDIRLQPHSTQVQWSADKNTFQLAPQWTGLTMALQGAASGRGMVRHEYGAWHWSVDEAAVSGPGWTVEGSFRPASGQKIQWEGSAQLDASTPFQSWIPDLPQDVVSVLPVSGVVTARGSVSFHVNAGIQSMLGTVSLSQLTGKLDGQPYLLEAPELRMETATCSGDSVVVQWAGNLAELDVENLSWKTWMGGGPVTGDLHVRAESIQVNPILTWWEHLNRPPADEAILLPLGSSLGVHLDSQTAEWDALRCTGVSARTKITHNRWVIQRAEAHGLEGRAEVEGSLAPGRAGWVLSLRGTADDVSMPKLFSTYSNFGQTLIRQEHLSGALSTSGTLGMSWDLAGKWHGEEFTANLQTRIAYGRLRKLEVFDEIANYLQGHRLMAPLVDPDDLRERLQDVAFEPVSQRIDVRGERVWLPMTVIQSSAMNVAIEGTYGFDSNIDYTLGFALRDLRASASDAFGEMEDDGLGNQFFLRMSGPVEEPVYAYDRDAAKEHRRAAIQAEKARLRDALRHRNDPAPDPSPLPPSPRLEPSAKTSPTPDKPEGSQERPGLLDRVRKPKGSKGKDLFNPDDDDYL